MVAAVDRHRGGHLGTRCGAQSRQPNHLTPASHVPRRNSQPGAILNAPVGTAAVGSNFIALTAIWASLYRVLTGLVLAFICAVTLGSLAFYFEIFGKLTLPTVTLLAPIASVAWIPLAIFAFGVGSGAAIFVVFVSVVFTLTLGTVNNMQQVDQLYIDTARVLGAIVGR